MMTAIGTHCGAQEGTHTLLHVTDSIAPECSCLSWKLWDRQLPLARAAQWWEKGTLKLQVGVMATILLRCV